MYNDDLNAPPVNPLPPVVIFLVCLIGGVEVLFQAAEAGFIGGPQAIGWRVSAVQDYAFSDTLFDWMRATGTYSAQNMLRFVSYTFLHQSMMHAIFALVFVLAIGKFVAEIMHPLAVLAVFLLSAAIGAAVISIILDDQFALIGAFPAVYGLLGAYTWLRFTELSEEGESRIRAFSLIIALICISIAFSIVGWLFEDINVGSSSIWLTRLMGFCAGFLLTMGLAPNSRQRIYKMLELTRQR